MKFRDHAAFFYHIIVAATPYILPPATGNKTVIPIFKRRTHNDLSIIQVLHDFFRLFHPAPPPDLSELFTLALSSQQGWLSPFPAKVNQ